LSFSCGVGPETKLRGVDRTCMIARILPGWEFIRNVERSDRNLALHGK
jgi:hypothetical protein